MITQYIPLPIQSPWSQTARYLPLVVFLIMICGITTGLAQETQSQGDEAAERFLQSYKSEVLDIDTTAQYAERPAAYENLRYLILPPPRHHIPRHLNLPSGMETWYTSYEVYPADFQSAWAFSGQGTHMIRTHGNIFMPVHPQFTDPIYNFTRGMFTPWGAGTWMMRSMLGGYPGMWGPFIY